MINKPKAKQEQDPAGALFALCTAGVFFVVNLFFATRHVMWRDEWMPLVVSKHTSGYAEFFEHIKYIGRLAYFSFAWILVQLDDSLLLFKFAIVLISSIGVFLLCRYAPLSRLQKILFSFGYFTLYEYGTILRDYSVILALSIGCCVVLCSRKWRPLLFCVVVALLFQTNPFGLALGCALALTFAFDSWRNGRLTRSSLRDPQLWLGTAIVIVSFVAAVTTMIPPPEITPIILGQDLRTDSHLARLGESLAFPIRAWLPVPIFGRWNSQVLDPWPWLQVFLSIGVAALIACVIATSRTALFLFLIGLLGVGMLLCHLPWTAMRYHGPYFILAVLSYWIYLRDSAMGRLAEDGARWREWLRAGAGSVLTAVLAVHVSVAALLLAQEHLVPFSGSRDAARIISETGGPDTVVVGDPDYLMIPLSGYLGREVYIASRGEMGSFTKVDAKRRGTPLSPQELSQVVSDVMAKHQRDIILVTPYELSLPSSVGSLLGAARGSTDESYMIYKLFCPRGSP